MDSVINYLFIIFPITANNGICLLIISFSILKSTKLPYIPSDTKK
jgi:hypothetical protein